MLTHSLVLESKTARRTTVRTTPSCSTRTPNAPLSLAQHPHKKEKEPLQNHDSYLSSRRQFLSTTATAAVAIGITTTTSITQLVPTVSNASELLEAKAVPSVVNEKEKDERTTTSSTTTETVAAGSSSIDWEMVFEKARRKALGGGKAGAAAAVVQVSTLMWLRTCMNYQYRYGGSFFEALDSLWKQGGIPRLYQGLPFALIQGPLTKFGDTAANTGVLAVLESLPQTQHLPLAVKTLCGSILAGGWRIVLMPVDSSKTVLQVEGAPGLKKLYQSVKDSYSLAPLYRGGLSTAGATIVGHLPWFLTYNTLNGQLPQVSDPSDLFSSIVRSAFIGLCASCVSDCSSNWLRVIKTTKQTAQLDSSNSISNDLSYAQVVQLILEKDGVAGLFGRGLQTRLFTNALQGAVFSVLWKYFQQAQGLS